MSSKQNAQTIEKKDTNNQKYEMRRWLIDKYEVKNQGQSKGNVV